VWKALLWCVFVRIIVVINVIVLNFRVTVQALRTVVQALVIIALQLIEPVSSEWRWQRSCGIAAQAHQGAHEAIKRAAFCNLEGALTPQ